MTRQEVIRARERLRDEFTEGRTRLIPTTREGYLLEFKFAGETLILSSEVEIDALARRWGKP